MIAAIRRLLSREAALDDAIEHYVSAPERLARLARLRQSVMSAWEGSLEMGEGNHLNHVYAPMMTGLVDVAAAAQRLAASPTDSIAQRELETALDRYLRDLEMAKLSGFEAADDEARQERERARQRKSLAAALFARYGNVEADQPSVKVPTGPATGHRPIKFWLEDAFDVLAYMHRYPNG